MQVLPLPTLGKKTRPPKLLTLEGLSVHTLSAVKRPHNNMIHKNFDKWNAESIKLALLEIEQRRKTEWQNAGLNKQKTKPAYRPLKGLVYVILGIPGPMYRCKIGRTSKAFSDRLSAIQSSSPLPLRVLLVVETLDSIRLEKGLHEHFEADRSHGEWFDLSPKLITEIETISLGFGQVVYRGEF